MTQEKNNSLVREFQKVLLDDTDFLKNQLAESQLRTVNLEQAGLSLKK